MIGVWRTYEIFHSPAAQLASYEALWSAPGDGNAPLNAIASILGTKSPPAVFFAARMLFRFVVGLIVVIFSRTITKAVLCAVLPRICNVIGINAELMPNTLNGPKNERPKAASKRSADRHDDGNKKNLTTAVRLVVYGIVGWTVVEPCFYIFKTIGIYEGAHAFINNINTTTYYSHCK